MIEETVEEERRMALGRQRAVQDALLIGRHEMPSAPEHVFYDRLNAVLDEAGFDREAEALCRPHYASGVGRPSIPPERYFRMLFVGYFEVLESERRIAWRCTDSLSLRRFLQLGPGEAVPDHSGLSRTRARLPLEAHDSVFALVLGLLAERGLIKGGRVGIDASTMEADAAMRSIVRREDGAGWQAVDRGPPPDRRASSPGPAGSRRPEHEQALDSCRGQLARAVLDRHPPRRGETWGWRCARV